MFPKTKKSFKVGRSSFVFRNVMFVSDDATILAVFFFFVLPAFTVSAGRCSQCLCADDPPKLVFLFKQINLPCVLLLHALFWFGPASL